MMLEVPLHDWLTLLFGATMKQDIMVKGCGKENSLFFFVAKKQRYRKMRGQKQDLASKGVLSSDQIPARYHLFQFQC